MIKVLIDGEEKEYINLNEACEKNIGKTIYLIPSKELEEQRPRITY